MNPRPMSTRACSPSDFLPDRDRMTAVHVSEQAVHDDHDVEIRGPKRVHLEVLGRQRRQEVRRARASTTIIPGNEEGRPACRRSRRPSPSMFQCVGIAVGQAGIEPGRRGDHADERQHKRDDPVDAASWLRLPFVVLRCREVPDPREHIFQHRRIQRVVDLLPLAAAADQVGLLEDREVVRHRRLASCRTTTPAPRPSARHAESSRRISRRVGSDNALKTEFSAIMSVHSPEPGII